jgi:hypothetical protein
MLLNGVEQSLRAFSAREAALGDSFTFARR